MSYERRIILGFILVFEMWCIAAAQENFSSTAQRSSLTVAAAVSGERVRITACLGSADARGSLCRKRGESLGYTGVYFRALLPTELYRQNSHHLLVDHSIARQNWRMVNVERRAVIV